MSISNFCLSVQEDNILCYEYFQIPLFFILTYTVLVTVEPQFFKINDNCHGCHGMPVVLGHVLRKTGTLLLLYSW